MPRPNARSPSITSQESYAAVMIADLIADVPVNLETEEEPQKQSKEETNMGYDGHLDGEETSPNLDDSTQKANGAGISRGVILNAVQFGQHDPKTKSDEKPIQLTAALPVPTLSQTISEPKGFKDMSFLRKVAFVFSFLPSVLFVLCFAIILPCNLPKPCVEEIWIQKFNDTEMTSGLEIPDNVMFTVLKHGENVLVELNKKNGVPKPIEVKLSASSTHLKCNKMRNKELTECIVIYETGQIRSFNNLQHKTLWKKTDGKASFPVMVSGCNGETEDVAIAVSNTTIILYNGTDVSPFTISDCDSVPTKLMHWVINDSSIIVFICEKGKEDRLISIPKDEWCIFTTPQEKPTVLQTGVLDSLKNSVLQPSKNGILLWSGNEASMVKPDGSELWRVSNLTHLETNRFILQGKFHGEHEQIAFLSSSLSTGLMVTLLDPSDGSLIKSFSVYPDVEATEVIHVQGKKRDFALILLKKNAKDIVSTAIHQINDISTTIANLVFNEEVGIATQRSISEELALLDLDGGSITIDTIKSTKDLKNGDYKSTMAAVSNKGTGVLSIYFISTSSDDAQMKTTEVRNIEVANWDKSTKSKCKI